MWVEIFKTMVHTHSYLGHLGVYVPPVGDGDIQIDGVFHSYANEFQQNPDRIEIKAPMPEAAVEAMMNCLAPLIDTDACPPDNRQRYVSFAG
jgi:UDP-N-acetylglucosamine enolpyruvyl transferase